MLSGSNGVKNLLCNTYCILDLPSLNKPKLLFSDMLRQYRFESMSNQLRYHFIYIVAEGNQHVIQK